MERTSILSKVGKTALYAVLAVALPVSLDDFGLLQDAE